MGNGALQNAPFGNTLPRDNYNPRLENGHLQMGCLQMGHFETSQFQCSELQRWD